MCSRAIGAPDDAGDTLPVETRVEPRLNEEVSHGEDDRVREG